MGLLLLQRKAVEQPLKLSSIYGQGLTRGIIRPPEAPLLQTTIVEPEAVVVPTQNLEFVTIPIAEYEETFVENIQFEGMGYDGRQSVDGFSHVGSAAGDVDGCFLKVVQHGFAPSARTTARRWSGSKLV